MSKLMMAILASTMLLALSLGAATQDHDCCPGDCCHKECCQRK